MNRSHRSVWNELPGACVAASEINSVRGRRSRRARTIGAIAGAAIASFGLCGPVASQTVLTSTALAGTDDATSVPVVGTTVYNTSTTAGATAVQPGAYIWNGTQWRRADSTYLNVNSTGANSQAIGSGSVAIGPQTTATAIDSIAIGNGANAVNGTGTVVIGSGASSSSSTGSRGSTVVIGQGAASTAEMGSTVVVGAGANSQVIRSVAIGTNASVTNSVSGAGLSQPGIYQAGGVAIGSDAMAVIDQSTSSAGGYTPVAIGTLSRALADGAIAVGEDAQATRTTAIATGAYSRATAINAIAIGAGAVSSTANSAALGSGATTAAAVGIGGATINGSYYTFAGGAPVGVVSVGSAGNERQITNVAAGQLNANSTDAVNGSQLFATNQAITNIQSGAGIRYFHANSAQADSDAQGLESVSIGPRAVSAGPASVALGLNAVSSGSNTVAIGNGSVATAADGIALGAGSNADRAGMNGQRELFSNAVVGSQQGALSVGSAGNERQITNVAGGTQATDAVNVRQLQAVQAGGVRYDTNADGTTNYNSVTLGNNTGATTISNVAPGVAGTDATNVNQLRSASAAATAYTDLRTNALGSEIRGVARNAYAGVAAAMAVQMPGSFIPGKTVMRIGGAVYKGESAVGVSFRRTAENNDWSLTGGVGMSRAGAAVTAGVEWVFN